MAEPINLNKARKAKARAEKDQRAAENRVTFGRTKAEKACDALVKAQAKTAMDDKKRED